MASYGWRQSRSVAEGLWEEMERDERVSIGDFLFTVLNADSRQIRLLKVHSTRSAGNRVRYGNGD